MEKESSDTSMMEYDFSEIFYHKELIENKVFSQKEARGMYDILVQIHSALRDKSTNTDFKLSIVEIGWFRGIDELLKKINAHVKNKEFKLIC